MFSRRATTAGVLPSGVRIGLNVLVIMGVFAMHNLMTSVSGEPQPHHEVMSVSAVADAGTTVVAEVLVPMSDGMHGVMSDCGGLMALCLALVLGAGAHVVLTKRLADRVLWQLPPPSSARPMVVVPPFNSRSPLERNCILRC